MLTFKDGGDNAIVVTKDKQTGYSFLTDDEKYVIVINIKGNIFIYKNSDDITTYKRGQTIGESSTGYKPITMLALQDLVSTFQNFKAPINIAYHPVTAPIILFKNSKTNELAIKMIIKMDDLYVYVTEYSTEQAFYTNETKFTDITGISCADFNPIAQIRGLAGVVYSEGPKIAEFLKSQKDLPNLGENK